MEIVLGILFWVAFLGGWWSRRLVDPFRRFLAAEPSTP